MYTGSSENMQGGARCSEAEAHFATLQRAVGAVRNARSEYDVPLGRKVRAIVVVEESSIRSAMQAEAPALCLLGKVELDTLQVCAAQCRRFRIGLPCMAYTCGKCLQQH